MDYDNSRKKSVAATGESSSQIKAVLARFFEQGFANATRSAGH